MKQGGGNDEQLAFAWGQVGDYHFERGSWAKAVQYYKQAKDLPKMAKCLYQLEDYRHLVDLVDELPHGATQLGELGEMFESVGLVEEAVRAHLRRGNPKAAVDASVRVNQWDRAVELAEEHGFPQIESLLARHTTRLLQRGDKLQAVEVYRLAGKATEAALLLAKMAEDAGKCKRRKRVDPLRAKKLHVLAALEVERHRRRTVEGVKMNTRQGRSAADVAAVTAATLNTLMATTSNSAEDKRAA
ncbi:unnamed protein product, partial [Discosporangium mesarthrocarpum]